MLMSALESTELADVLADYGVTAACLRVPAHGLINTTLIVEQANGPKFVLQRLHPSLPAEVNLNLEIVTDWLAARGHVSPRLVRTREGAAWVRRGDAVFRLLTHVAGTATATLTDTTMAARAGSLLGGFHAALAEFTAPLPCQRPPVHAPARHRAFLDATLARHRDHPRVAAVGQLAAEIHAALDTVPPVPTTPPRLLHGDPKLSNLLFDSPGCLVDLDTLVRAQLPFEMGDALRSWCNRQPEDAASARFDIDFFASALAGYADATRDFLLPEEAAAFVAGTETVCLELAMRFAADALNECYFGWDSQRFATRGEHNLVRAANQLALARDVRLQRAAAQAVVMKLWPTTRLLAS